MSHTKFWMVLKKSGNTIPVARHVDRCEAVAEAERLARKHNECFYVLEAIGIAEPQEPPVVYQMLYQQSTQGGF